MSKIMLRQIIIPISEEEGYFNLRPFDMDEDLHESSKRSIISNISKLVRILKISFFSLLSSINSNLSKAKQIP